MKTASLANRMAALQELGIFERHVVIPFEKNTVAIAQVTRQEPKLDKPLEGGVPGALGNDMVIITGDDGEFFNESVFGLPLLQSVRNKLFDPIDNVCGARHGTAQKLFTVDGAPLIYASTRPHSYDVLGNIGIDDPEKATSAIAGALYLAASANANRVIMGAGIFDDGQLINDYDEARMVVSGVRDSEVKGIEFTVLTCRPAQQGAYTYVFKQVAEGNEDILTEPDSSFGYSKLPRR